MRSHFVTPLSSQLQKMCGMIVPSGGCLRMSTDFQSLTPTGEALATAGERSSALLMIGWFSVGLAVAAIGVLVGAELRSRYKFNHRTPYDFYSNAGERPASEFGVGV